MKVLTDAHEELLAAITVIVETSGTVDKQYSFNPSCTPAVPQLDVVGLL